MFHFFLHFVSFLSLGVAQQSSQSPMSLTSDASSPRSYVSPRISTPQTNTASLKPPLSTTPVSSQTKVNTHFSLGLKLQMCLCQVVQFTPSSSLLPLGISLSLYQVNTLGIKASSLPPPSSQQPLPSDKHHDNSNSPRTLQRQRSVSISQTKKNSQQMHNMSIHLVPVLTRS